MRPNWGENKVINHLLSLRRDAWEKLQEGAEGADFWRGRLTGFDLVLADLHPAHQQFQTHTPCKRRCDHWTAWGCETCKGACKCHWMQDLEGVAIDVLDDTGTLSLPVFDTFVSEQSPAIALFPDGWHELTTPRVSLVRMTLTHSEVVAGLRFYEDRFGIMPTNILLNHAAGRYGVLLYQGCGGPCTPKK